MPRPPRKPSALTNHLFLGASPARRSALSKEELRSAAWHHLHRNTYADADIPLTHGLRCAAAGLVIPAAAAVGGRSAAWMHGIELIDTDDPVEIVTLPANRFGPVKGMSIHVTDLAPDDVVTVGSLKVTSPARTAWDIARFHPPPEAVAYLDAMLRARVIATPDLHDRLAASTIRWGRKRIATSFGLVSLRSESPQESRMRVRLTLAGVPPAEPQHPVYDRGRFIARVDLGWPAQRVAAEYDGVWHAKTGQFHRDRRRLNRLVAAGWVVIHVTAVRLHDDFDTVIEEIRTALART